MDDLDVMLALSFVGHCFGIVLQIMTVIIIIFELFGAKDTIVPCLGSDRRKGQVCRIKMSLSKSLSL